MRFVITGEWDKNLALREILQAIDGDSGDGNLADAQRRRVDSGRPCNGPGQIDVAGVNVDYRLWGG